MAGNSEKDNAVMTVGQLNELAHQNIILLIDYKTKEGNVAFKLIKDCKRKPRFPEGNCYLAWVRLASKYQHLDLKNHNEWVTELENLRAQINDTKFSSPITNWNFWVML